MEIGKVTGLPNGIYIGEFIFSADKDNNLWMRNDDGEAMQLGKKEEDELNALLKEFFKKNL